MTSTRARLQRLAAIWANGPDAARDPEVDRALALGPGTLIVLGDVSGIQDYVLAPVPGAGGAARRLRARSWTVSILAEVAARAVAERLGRPTAAPLLSGAGRFVLPVEAPPADAHARLEGLKREIDVACLDAFGARLSLGLGWAPLRGPGLPWTELVASLEERRGRRLAGALTDEAGSWMPERFVRPLEEPAGRCDGCAATATLARGDDPEALLCAACRRDEALGRKLPRARFLAIAPVAAGAPSPGRAAPLSLLGFSIALEEHPPDGRPAELVLALDPSEGAGTVRAFPLARHAPAGGGRGASLDFDEIARLSTGVARLGYLRIDVDRAGRAVADLEGDAARTVALSLLLHGFFAARVEELVRERFAEVYVVYGGGDDLFLVGPWDRTIDFALALREEFRSLVGDRLSFSAGLSVEKPRAHVLAASERAAAALERAKERGTRLRPDSGGRDQIDFLGATMGWPEAVRAVERARTVATWVRDGRLPHAFVHAASTLHADFREWFAARERRAIPDGRVRRFAPLLAYHAQRNLRDPEARAWAESLTRSRSEDWPSFDWIARYVGLATRDRDEGGTP